ncbi:MAG: transposase family protein [Burkholderiales bacterium]|nr:transposase family protein [Burkholderiales bacterium]
MPGPAKRREINIPGRSVQVDVKHVKLTSGRLYQFTAIDEATRYRVLKIYDHNSMRSAVDFIEQLRQRLPVAIQRIQTDWGAEFGTHFTWHLEDLGIEHRHIPPGCPEVNGKVERSHRTDEEEFYGRTTFRSPQELRRALRDWEVEYNERRPHLALKGKTPAERLLELRISARSPVGVST